MEQVCRCVVQACSCGLADLWATHLLLVGSFFSKVLRASSCRKGKIPVREREI